MLDFYILYQKHRIHEHVLYKIQLLFRISNLFYYTLCSFGFSDRNSRFRSLTYCKMNSINSKYLMCIVYQVKTYCWCLHMIYYVFQIKYSLKGSIYSIIFRTSLSNGGRPHCEFCKILLGLVLDKTWNSLHFSYLTVLNLLVFLELLTAHWKHKQSINGKCTSL